MRIGRQLTVQQVYNIVNEYNSTYELSETQINNILQNTDNAIGKLAYTLGVKVCEFPVSYLYAAQQSIANEGLHAITWTLANPDNLGAWAVGDPTKINIVTTGVYEMHFFCTFATNEIGRRGVIFVGGGNPPLERYEVACLGHSTRITLSGSNRITSTGTFQIKVHQNSGGALNLEDAYLLLIRRSFLLG